jgi:hypothetical protein
MKFLVVGAWQWSWYHQAFSDALAILGHEVRPFGWAELFLDGLQVEQGARPKSLWTRLQDRVIWGPLVSRLNDHLVDEALAFRPDVVFVYNGTHVRPSTLNQIKQGVPSLKLVQYCNDNPFSKRADRLLWRHLKRGLPIYDIHFVYRQANFDDVRRHGGREVHLLRSYYVAETDFRVAVDESDGAFHSDVLFAGHYEPDARIDCLEGVARLGVNFKLFGGTWYLAGQRLDARSPLRPFMPVRPLVRADYRKAISGTKIALCFLSKLNGDTYTRRSFEIPAMRSFMLSEYTDDLASMFREGEEAEFFRSKEELLDKIKYYLKHDAKRQAVADAGHRRLLRDGHDVVSRARDFVSVIERSTQSNEKGSHARPAISPTADRGVALRTNSPETDRSGDDHGSH